MPEEKIKEIDKFDIHRVDNGYTIYLEYKVVDEKGYEWRRYKTLIATSLEEVHALVGVWFEIFDKAQAV